MIKRFYVENYGSIKDRVDITFEASPLKDNTSFYNSFEFKNLDVLKVLSFYGANASGKTFIVRAFEALRSLIVPTPIVNGFLVQQGYILPYMPFKFSKEKSTSPITFGIEFSLDNKDKSPLYRYEVSFNSKVITRERFEKQTSQKFSLLFERKDEKKDKPTINFGSNALNNALLKDLGNTLMPNRTFLSMFNSFNIADFHDAFEFFAKRLIVVSTELPNNVETIPVEMQKNNAEFKEFALRLLKAADFNIKDIRLDKRPKQALFNNLPDQYSLLFEHEGDVDNATIDYLYESLGTKKILLLAAFLYPTLKQSSILVMDELESSLHPNLARLIVEFFLDSSINTHNSQLIFTSHETTLLDLNLLRRDQIIFVYKDKKLLNTYIESLKDFSVRKTDNVRASYLAGRYETSPDINSYYLLETNHGKKEEVS